MKEYFWNNLWALDRALNALFGGSSKEFMSTRIYNNRINNQLAWALYMFLNTLDPDHCERAAIRDYDKDHSKRIDLVFEPCKICGSTDPFHHTFHPHDNK